MYLRATLILLSFFFFNDTATTEIYTLSLHDALPIYFIVGDNDGVVVIPREVMPQVLERAEEVVHTENEVRKRSEEHTSELQSRLHLVCRLLLEKKKTTTTLTRPHKNYDITLYIKHTD